jgi:hypothetical protein
MASILKEGKEFLFEENYFGQRTQRMQRIPCPFFLYVFVPCMVQINAIKKLLKPIGILALR